MVGFIGRRFHDSSQNYPFAPTDLKEFHIPHDLFEVPTLPFRFYGHSFAALLARVCQILEVHKLSDLIFQAEPPVLGSPPSKPDR
jgi:hypothetical protein